MSNDRPSSRAEREERLDVVVTAYLEAIEAGQSGDPSIWLARHPDLAPELQEFFADLNQVDRVAAPFRAAAFEAGRPPAEALGGPHQDNRLHVPRQSIGDYELLEEVGRGGMGVVYRARQKKLNRVVALKMIRTGAWATEGESSRFRNEAEAAAGLDHPHIVPVYEVGEEHGQLYFSMKFIEGGTLAGTMADRIEPRHAARLVETVARAVHHAHQRGILHRDLKPSNILMDQHGEPHVTDFGLAKRLDSAAALTQTGAMVGTPGYMAPEQSSSNRAALSTATDVYGLGAIFYALLAGRAPSGSDTPVETPPEFTEPTSDPPARLTSGINRDLETVCLKCLEKEPGRRYASAEALADDLRRWLDGKPIEARPVSRTARTWSWCRRNQLVAGLLLAVGVLLAALVGGLAVSNVALLREQEQTANAFLLARKHEQVARQHLYVAHIRQTGNSLNATDPREALNTLMQDVPAAGQRDLRGFEWHYLQALAERRCTPALTLRGHVGDVYCAVFSPNGRLLVTGGQDGTARVWDRVSGQLLATLPCHTSDVNCVAFSPDGRTLATASDDGTIKLWDIATGQEHRHVAKFPYEVNEVAFSPDGKTLAAGLSTGDVVRWDFPSGKEQPVLKAESRARIESLAFAPDGKNLAVAGGRSPVWDLATGKRRFALNTVGGDWENCVAYSHDGRSLAIARAKTSVVLVDAASGRETATLGGPLGQAESVCFAPDDRLLASAGDDGTVRLWELPSGKPRAVFAASDQRVWSVAFSPDGGMLATTSRDGLVKLWRMDAQASYQPLAGQPSWFRMGPIFSGDGKRMVTAGFDSTIRAWNSASARTEFSLPGMPDCLTFSPDTERLAVSQIDGTVVLWDLLRRQQLAHFRVHSPDGQSRPVQLGSLVFAPDGKTLLSWDILNGTVMQLDATTGELRGKLLQPVSKSAAFSADGRQFLFRFTGSPEEPRVFLNLLNLESRQLHRSPPDQALPDFVSFVLGPGSSFATVGTDRKVRIWDMATLSPRSTLPHRDNVVSACFSADGRTLATGGDDGIVRLWNVALGEEMLALDAPPIPVHAVAFSPDGSTLAARFYQMPDRSGINLWRSSSCGTGPASFAESGQSDSQGAWLGRRRDAKP
jgi:WD40 repeat protein/tRNA A-37 threonylcarbamoyl transferase component Bud32